MKLTSIVAAGAAVATLVAAPALAQTNTMASGKMAAGGSAMSATPASPAMPAKKPMKHSKKMAKKAKPAMASGATSTGNTTAPK